MATQTKYQKLIAALVTPAQTLEDTMQQVFVGRLLDYAVGDQLTTIGEIVGRPRNGISDDEIYRRIVRAQIAVNTSDGLIADLLTVTDLVVYDDDATYILRNWGGGNATLLVDDVVITWGVAELLIELLRKSKAAGVRLTIEFFIEDPAGAFAFEGGSDGDGWGDTLDPDTGGTFASTLE